MRKQKARCKEKQVLRPSSCPIDHKPSLTRTPDPVWRITRGFGLGHPHGLRHTAITEALDITGGDIRAVQRFSRHKDMRILILYDDNRTDLGGQVARRVAARFSAF